MGTRVVSTHSFDSVWLWSRYLVIIEEFGFELDLDAAKVSLSREKILGPMQDEFKIHPSSCAGLCLPLSSSMDSRLHG